MLEVGNILKTDFDIWFANPAYKGLEDLAPAADDDKAVATIRELLRGNITEIRQRVQDVHYGVSMLQTFGDAADTIGGKLSRMEELTDHAANGFHSATEKAAMQQELESLAGEINNIVENTKYDGNKLFTASGKTISISVDNNSTIDIFAQDLSVDVGGMDLTTDAGGALKSLQPIIKAFSEYSGYLSSQTAHLGDAVAIIEFEFDNAMGVELDNFNINIAMEVAGWTMSEVPNGMPVLLETQANVTSDRALQLYGALSVPG